jgi:hypothetical protein
MKLSFIKYLTSTFLNNGIFNLPHICRNNINQIIFLTQPEFLSSNSINILKEIFTALIRENIFYSYALGY